MGEINIKSSTIEKGFDLAKEFIQSILKPSLDELGELFADKVKLRRLSNQVRHINKIKAIVKKEGITTRAINMKVLSPYLNAVALEEDETLQDTWANLFINYIDTSVNLTLTVYPEILRQLSSEEVKMLNHIYSNGYYSELDMVFDNIEDDIERNRKQECKANLLRLGIIKEEIAIDDNSLTQGNAYFLPTQYKYRETGKYTFSEFGYYFFKACTRNTTDSL